VFLGVTNLSGT